MAGPTTEAPPAKAAPASAQLWIRMDKETHARFGAACKLLGLSQHEVVTRAARETIARSGIDQIRPTH